MCDEGHLPETEEHYLNQQILSAYNKKISHSGTD